MPPTADAATPKPASSLRTPEQMEWIRDRFKPDGLERLARAGREYADDHGYYLPDVAALAYAEWERAERLHDALVAMLDAVEDYGLDAAFGDEKFKAIVAARKAVRRGA